MIRDARRGKDMSLENGKRRRRRGQEKAVRSTKGQWGKVSIRDAEKEFQMEDVPFGVRGRILFLTPEQRKEKEKLNQFFNRGKRI